ncbi:MAG: hypothetical protein SNJ73_02550 [Acetobacteraceae bacterium]
MIGIWSFRDLSRWDAFTIPQIAFPEGVERVRLGAVLAPRRELLTDAERAAPNLQPITIHFGGSISKRAHAPDRRFTMALQWAHPGDIVLSKIDLKNGALGVVPDWSNVVITTHFAAYVAEKERLVPEYLVRLVQTQHFKDWLWSSRSGTDGRTEVKLDLLEGLEIPLPPLDRQRELVEAHDALIAQAAALDAQAGQVEADALAAFEKALGYGPQPPLPDRPIFIAQFRELDRWSHDAILRRQIGGDEGAAFPVKALGDVVADLENGWSPRCLDRPAEGEEWGVLKVSAVSGRVYRAAQNKALPATLKAKPTLTVVAGDVLIARASGDAKLVGAAAYVEDTPPRLMISDKVFRVVFLEDSPVRAKFVAAVLATNGVRSQIMSEFSNDSGMAKNIAKPALLALRFPLPPLDVQDTMIAALDAARAEAARLRAEAEALRVRAARGFEEAVYGAAEAGPPVEPAAA